MYNKMVNFCLPKVKLKDDTSDISNPENTILGQKFTSQPDFSTDEKHRGIFRDSIEGYISSLSFELHSSDLCDHIDSSDLDTYVINLDKINEMNKTGETDKSNDTRGNIFLKKQSSPVNIPISVRRFKEVLSSKDKNINDIRDIENIGGTQDISDKMQNIVHYSIEQVTCINCKKQMIRMKNDVNSIYCSLDCMNEHINTLEIIECLFCNIEFIRNKLEKYKIFCSDKCLEQGRYKIKTKCIDCGITLHLEIKYQYKIYRCYNCQQRFLSIEC